MAIFDIFTRVDRHVDLMDDMMVTLRVRQSIVELPGGANVLRRATLRCLNCRDTEACRAWLDENWEADEAPPYCLNHDLFARVKRRNEASDPAEVSA
jgi:hypothetical protein